mmetsp:Transcript_26909/g.70705  ORF Transcript_26909/g.70705 Transcript_26909/m.70705 type:complete len:296 (-) Transcript_26909:1343-2230(-)
MHEVAERVDAFLKHTVGRRVRDHDGSQVVRVLLALGLQVSIVNLAVRPYFDVDHLHPRHHGRGRVGAVRRRRHQADVTVVIAPGVVVPTDGHEASQFALSTRVGLERQVVVARYIAEHLLRLLKERQVPLRLVKRSVRVHVCKRRHGHPLHLDRRVELHRARSERDHRVAKRHILVLEVLQVPHHLGLRVVQVEDLLLKELGLALKPSASNDRWRLGPVGQDGGPTEELCELIDVGRGGCLVYGDGNRVGIQLPKVHFLGGRPRNNVVGGGASQLDRHRVKEDVVADRVAASLGG